MSPSKKSPSLFPDYTAGNDGVNFRLVFGSQCDICESSPTTVVKYKQGLNGISAHLEEKYSLPTNPLPATLIMKALTDKLGIECGCYAKFQRQLVHISRAMARKEKKHSA